MSEQEVTCLRCGQVEIDCVCNQGFCANVYDRISELEQEAERLRESKEWWEANAIQWREQCEKAWSQRGSAIGRISELEQEVEQLHSTLDALKDPNEVHALMLKGAIATISWRQHCHLTGEVPNTSDHHLSELVKAREEAERLRSTLVDMVIQFAYQNRDGLLITGGLSALEDAFDALGIDEKTDPYSLLQPKGQSCSLTDP